MAETVRFIGLDDLLSDMQDLITKAPDELNTAVIKVAKDWSKDCNDKMPSGYSGKSIKNEEGKRVVNKASLKRWKTKITYNSLGMVSNVEVVNRAPHFHLVENGHRKVLFGHDTGGFVPGKHYAEKTRKEYESKYPEKMEQAINKIMEDRGFT